MTWSPLEGETHIGSANMQAAASNSLILTDFSSYKQFAEREAQPKHGGLYQGVAQSLTHVLQETRTVAQAIAILVRAADEAYFTRRLDVVGHLGQLLRTLRFSPEVESIGHYYQALSLNQGGLGDTTRAGLLFEQVADNGSLQYKARAMLALGTNSAMSGDHHASAYFYREVMRLTSRRYAFEPVTLHTTSRMTAVLRSMEGDHSGALAHLEGMFPLARLVGSVQPHAYYDYLNTLAVELCAVGRLEEAKNASEIALASPFAPAYPEWHETRYEIELRRRRASRSTLGVNHPVTVTAEPIASNPSPEAQPSSPFLAEPAVVSVDVNHAPAEASNVLRFPVRGQNVGSVLARSSTGTSEPARVIVMSDRNTAVGRDSSTTTHVKKSYGDLDGRQLLLKIMELTAARDITDYELLEILESIESILYKQKDPGKP